MKMQISLIGGGLVGSLLSIILARKGYTVDVFESRTDMRKTDISAGRSINLALANRGIKPLQALGLMDDINDMLIPMSGRMVHVDGQTPSLQPYGQSSKEVIYSISRAKLNSYLMSQAEATGRVTFYFEHKITDIDFNSMCFTADVKELVDGQSKVSSKRYSFQRIIGTDGANSPVRKAIVDALSEQSGKQSNSTSLFSLSEDTLDHSYKELTIAPTADGQFQLEPNALHIWPRGEFMLIALPNLDASFTATLFMPNKGFTSFDSIRTEDEVQQFFNSHFATATPLLDNLTDSFLQNPTGKLATIKCSPWQFEDKALIIGDAAHAIVPFHGQGMNCGFEDCDAIASIIPDAKDAEAKADWTALFTQVENMRKENADAIADMALENYIEMRDSVMQHEFLLQKQFAAKIQQSFPNRFTPRYAMVMFEHRPYSEAYRLGEKHKQLLAELSDRYSCPTQLTDDIIESLLDKYQL